MANKQYAQHISKQGRKWELDGDTREEYESATEWVVKSEDGSERYFLPKSEYVLCPPPERWVDVTAECEVDEDGAICHRGGHTTMIRDGYRRRKVQIADVTIGGAVAMSLKAPRWAFIIEQKVTG